MSNEVFTSFDYQVKVIKRSQRTQDGVTQTLEQEIEVPFSTFNQVGGQVQTARVVITHEQFISIPTTRIELIPAPGPGKLIVPLSVVLRSDFTGGAYTGDTTDEHALIFGWENFDWGSIINTTDQGNLFNILLLQSDQPYVWIVPSGHIWTFSTDIDGLALDAIMAAAQVTNNAFQVWMNPDIDHGGANLTGGNAKNTLSINVIYKVIDV